MSSRFCVRLNALTGTEGAVNVLASSRMDTTILVRALDSVVVSSAR